MNTLAENEPYSEVRLLREQDRVERGDRPHWLHWLIIATSVLATVAAWQLVRGQAEQGLRNQFENEANRVLELMSERMGKYEGALWGGVAAIRSQGSRMDHLAWRRFSETLRLERHYPGMSGIGVIHYKRAGKIDGFLAEQRKARPGFNIHPIHAEKEFFPVTFIEPAELNAAFLGLDMAHEANRYSAAKKARDTGTAQLTGPVTLVPDTEETQGLLLYAPFYDGGPYDGMAERRRHFRGMVFAPFTFSQFLEGALEKDRRRVGIRVTDGGRVLYDENVPLEKEFDPVPLFRKAATVDMLGRAWTFEIVSDRSFGEVASADGARFVLAVGMTISALLVVFLGSLARSNRRAVRFAGKMTKAYQNKADQLSGTEQLADERTAELREFIEDLADSKSALLESKIETRNAKQRLLDALETSPNGLLLFDKDDRLVMFNGVAAQINRTLGRELISGMNFSDYLRSHLEIQFPDASPGEIDEKLTAALSDHKTLLEDGTTDTVECRIGSDLWVRRTHKRTVEGGTIGVLADISEGRRSRQTIEAQSRELARSNSELEQFAYLASHDMQEPLRMIASFCDLLQLRYADKLDDDGKEFIAFAVEGAGRMRSLLDDLLIYSRVGRSEIKMAPVPLDGVLEDVKEHLGSLIEDNNAEVISEALPTVPGDRTLLTQLLQHLIGNAIKFHGDAPPQVRISAEKGQDEWTIAVTDNGIGIEAEYADKVFQMFQRLHGRDDYVGNGLGLALCKRAVERQGGRIWIESAVDPGSTIKFTLPVG